MTLRRTIRRGALRALIAGTAVLTMLFAGAFTAVAADAAATATITGHVTREDDGAPVAGVQVVATSDAGGGQIEAYTDATGAYVLEGIGSGEHVVHFRPADATLLHEYWNNTRSLFSAERVSVTDGATVTGIDAALAAPGSISGTVARDVDGAPLAGVSVVVSGVVSGAWASAFTDLNGAYTISSLPADSYIVSFRVDGTDLMDEYWEDALEWAAATPVVLASGAAVTDIDAALAVGGSISGTVIRASDSAPVAGATILALDANNEIAGQTQSESDGTYRLDGLAPGAYSVQFLPSDPSLANEYWQDARSWSASTPVDVLAGQVLNGIDAALENVGHLIGTVTKASDGSPVIGASVIVQETAGRGGSVTSGWVQADGSFDIAVPPGVYTLRFSTSDSGLLDEYWDDARSAAAATPVTVASGAQTTGLDVELESAAFVTGIVTLESSEDREVLVEAYDGDVLVASTHASLEDGTYSLKVPAGAHILKASAIFYNGSETIAEPQFYDGVSEAKDATPVTSVSGGTVAGIDFTLVATTPEPKPTLALSATSVKAGGDITVTGENFAPGETVVFELHSDPIPLGELVAAEDGTLSGTLRIPSTVPAGAHHIVALGEESAIEVSVAIDVTATAGGGAGGSGTGSNGGGSGLANTGAVVPVTAVLAGLFLAALGALLVRRRRAAS